MADQTTKELLDIIFDLRKQIERHQYDQKWHQETYRINQSLDQAATEWNSITIMGHVYGINSGRNFYIHNGSVHYDIRTKDDPVSKGDIVMVFGQIAYHVAHDQESRDGGSMGVDTIVIEPDRIQIITKSDRNIILPEKS